VKVFNQKILSYLRCPRCGIVFQVKGNFLICKGCGQKYKIVGHCLLRDPEVFVSDYEFSREKWDNYYRGSCLKKLENEENEYLQRHLNEIYKQISEYKPIKEVVYLEIGCGLMFFGQKIARDCQLVIGVDFSETALRIAEKLFKKKGIKNFFLIQTDIRKMPLRENSIDLSYGGGVIEHFKDTQTCIDELYRVLKPGGVSFNTVPYLNLGSLIYRQVWGNIPNIPILKQLAEFVHIRLLGARHMRFGYEMSFLGMTLKRIHKKAGFRTVVVDKFDVSLILALVPNYFRPFLTKLANYTRLFWPMIKIIGKK